MAGKSLSATSVIPVFAMTLLNECRRTALLMAGNSTKQTLRSIWQLPRLLLTMQLTDSLAANFKPAELRMHCS